jgi:CDP-diacylglycerol pyrophosphatase
MPLEQNDLSKCLLSGVRCTLVFSLLIPIERENGITSCTILQRDDRDFSDQVWKSRWCSACQLYVVLPTVETVAGLNTQQAGRREQAELVSWSVTNLLSQCKVGSTPSEHIQPDS